MADPLVDRCPSCGVALEGERRSVRYKGKLTVIDLVVRDDDGNETKLEHVCGD